DKRVTRSVAHDTKHAFPEEGSSHADAVESAYELTVLPDFGAVGMTEFVHFVVSAFDFVGDPCAFLPRTRDVFAMLNHIVKCLVGRELECVSVEQRFDGLVDL